MKSSFISLIKGEKEVEVPCFELESHNDLKNIYLNLLKIKIFQNEPCIKLPNGQYVEIKKFLEMSKMKLTERGVQITSEIILNKHARGGKKKDRIVIDGSFSFSLVAINGLMNGEKFFSGSVSSLEFDIRGNESKYLTEKIIQMNEQSDFKGHDEVTKKKLEECFKNENINTLYGLIELESIAFKILEGPILDTFLIEELAKKGIYEKYLPMSLMTACATSDTSFLKKLLNGSFKIKLKHLYCENYSDKQYHHSFKFTPLQLCIFLGHSEHVEIIKEYAKKILLDQLPNIYWLETWNKAPKQLRIPDNTTEIQKEGVLEKDKINSTIAEKYILEKIGKSINTIEYANLKKCFKIGSDFFYYRDHKIAHHIIASPVFSPFLIDELAKKGICRFELPLSLMVACASSDSSHLTNLLKDLLSEDCSYSLLKNPDLNNINPLFSDVFDGISKVHNFPKTAIQMCIFSGHADRVDLLTNFVLELLMQYIPKKTPFLPFKQSPQGMILHGTRANFENGYTRIDKN